MKIFENRRDAGRRVAALLGAYQGKSDVIVLALPRGGVPVGYEIASKLCVPLDVLVVRKLGVPGHEELAMGAIASGGARVVDRGLVSALGITRDQLEFVIDQERAELERRERALRGVRGEPLAVEGKTAIVVDDGLATGSTMLAAIEALRARRPARAVVAVPVAPPEACQALRARVDEMICLVTPPRLVAVGLWYQDFSQTTDDEVRALLEQSARERAQEPQRAAEGAEAHT